MTEVPNGGHARWEGDAAAYALDALDEAEVRAFEEHLAACSRCQSELAVMRRAVEGLPAAPQVDPGPELKQRVVLGELATWGQGEQGRVPRSQCLEIQVREAPQ